MSFKSLVRNLSKNFVPLFENNEVVLQSCLGRFIRSLHFIFTVSDFLLDCRQGFLDVDQRSLLDVHFQAVHVSAEIAGEEGFA